MKVKRYVASTVQEAIKNVKLELGHDAIIMSTRKIRQKGLLGWIKKPLVEVVAAVDDIAIAETNNKQYEKEQGGEKALENLEKKVDAMGDMIDKLLKGMYAEAQEDNLDLPSECLPYYKLLIENEVDEEFAKILVNQALTLREEKGIDIHSAVEEAILKYLGTPKPLKIDSEEPRTAMFLGPTGVGKTTTLAKLAAIYSIQHQKNVGLITADTYRIGAVDQLKIYAQILGVPLSIIYNPNELPDAISYHSDKDVILIDTAGRSMKYSNLEKEISQLLSYGRIDEIYLVLGSNISYKGCASIIDNYRFLPDYKLIFTKIDEIQSYGLLLNCCMLSQKPLSYLTTGQNVPDDIEIADPNKIKNLLIGSFKA